MRGVVVSGVLYLLHVLNDPPCFSNLDGVNSDKKKENGK